MTNGEAFLNKLATLLMSRRFLLTVVFLVISVFGTPEMQIDREGASAEVVDTIFALFPMFSPLIGFLTLLVSYTKSPTLGKEFFNRVTDGAVIEKLVDLIEVIKPLVTDTEPQE